MKPLRHQIDYFLTNPDFISWVKHPTSQSDFFWKTWLKNHPQDKKAFYNAKVILQRTSFGATKVSTNRQEEILGNILKDKVSPLYRQKKYFGIRTAKIHPWITKGVAAVFLILLASTFYYRFFQDKENKEFHLTTYMVTKNSNKGEKTTFFLPDSSQVTLNAESRLTYPSQFNSDFREVVLVGEAYFDVRHEANRKFMVRSGDIVTTVHGTAFNVKAYTDQKPINVSLERGLVSVHSQMNFMKGVSYDILPGEKLTVGKDFRKSIKSVFDYESEFGWREGILVFKDADLDDFILLLERWYGVDVNVMGENGESWSINGRFKQESLENVLKSLAFSTGVAYKIHDKQVTIYLDNN